MDQNLMVQELSDNELEQVVGGFTVTETTTHIKSSQKQSSSYKLSITDTYNSKYSVDTVIETLDIQP
jgi:bacteriocin-like protein